MNRMTRAVTYLFIVMVFSACAFLNKSSKPEPKSSPEVQSSPQQSATAEVPKPPIAPGDLQVGQASGSFTSKGEVVELKYAYAGRGERFSEESIIILVTDKPIPSEALTEEIKDQTLLLGEKIKGLEYVISENGMWVRFHPGQYQESTSNKLKDYSVEGDIVRGTDEGSDLSDGKYNRNVKFVAAIVK